MWINKEVYDDMMKDLEKYRRKAQELDALAAEVEILGSQDTGRVIIEGKCVLISWDYFHQLHSENQNLKKKAKLLSSEKDWWRTQYALERCARELNDIDFKSLKEAMESFIQTQLNQQGGCSDGRIGDTSTE